MSGKVREYEGEKIVVHYDAKRCIHVAECVEGLPKAFQRDRRPWVDPDAARADDRHVFNALDQLLDGIQGHRFDQRAVDAPTDQTASFRIAGGPSRRCADD